MTPVCPDYRGGIVKVPLSAFEGIDEELHSYETLIQA